MLTSCIRGSLLNNQAFVLLAKDLIRLWNSDNRISVWTFALVGIRVGMVPSHQFTAINMLQVSQRRAGEFAAGVAADHAAAHAAALLPTPLPFDLVVGRAVLGHAPRHAHPPAVAAETLPVGQSGGFGGHLHPTGDLGLRQPEYLLLSGHAGRMASRARMSSEGDGHHDALAQGRRSWSGLR